MGQVIAFTARRHVAEEGRAPSGTAQILLFLGVRYERTATDTAMRPPVETPRGTSTGN